MRTSLRASILPGVGVAVSRANMANLLVITMYGKTPYASMAVLLQVTLDYRDKGKELGVPEHLNSIGNPITRLGAGWG
jgi:hypothetical protein